MSDTIICTKCHRKKAMHHFIGKGGKATKTCQLCRKVDLIPNQVKLTKIPVDPQDYQIESSESESSESDSSSYESSDDSGSESEDFHMVCDSCNKQFYDYESAKRHVQSSQHLKRLQQ